MRQAANSKEEHLMNYLVSLGLILLLLSGCRTFIVPGNYTLGKVKLYEGSSLPDSEISIFQGVSCQEWEDVKSGRAVVPVTHGWWSTTDRVDDKYADGEPVTGYLDYSWREKRSPPEGKVNIDYHLEPGTHSIETHIYSYLTSRIGTLHTISKPVSAKYRLVYNFKKGVRYRIGAHVEMIEGWTMERALYILTAWLQQVDADGSVVDVAKFTPISGPSS